MIVVRYSDQGIIHFRTRKQLFVFKSRAQLGLEEWKLKRELWCSETHDLWHKACSSIEQYTSSYSLHAAGSVLGLGLGLNCLIKLSMFCVTPYLQISSLSKQALILSTINLRIYTSAYTFHVLSWRELGGGLCIKFLTILNL